MSNEKKKRKKADIHDSKISDAETGIENNDADLNATRLDIDNVDKGVVHKSGDLYLGNSIIRARKIGVQIGHNPVEDFIEALESHLDDTNRARIKPEIDALRVAKEPSKKKEIGLKILAWVGANIGRPIAEELGKRGSEFIPKG